MMQCHGRQSYTRLGVWYVQDVSLHLWAVLMGTLLGYRHTNRSTRFGCTFYVITAQPEVWVWLDALYLSGFLYEEGITFFIISNGFWSVIVLRILFFFFSFLAVGHLWDEEVLSPSWHLDPSGTSRWWVVYDIHICEFNWMSDLKLPLPRITRQTWLLVDSNKVWH